MKIALLGKGKTGSKIIELFPDVSVFDTKNPPTVEKLKEHDVIISFIPGEAFREMIPLLLETSKPVVTGSTGFEWPKDFHHTLQRKNISWIFATNFSLGMVVVKSLIQRLQEFSHLFTDQQFSIHEVHHTRKLDSPSGTALSMKEWLKAPCNITSERLGDVIGLHTLTFETPSEIIRIEHEAKDRLLFAEGALWAAKNIHSLSPGLFSFQDVVENKLSQTGEKL